MRKLAAIFFISMPFVSPSFPNVALFVLPSLAVLRVFILCLIAN